MHMTLCMTYPCTIIIINCLSIDTSTDDQSSTQELPVNTLNLETELPTSINIGTARPSSKFLIPISVLGSVITIILCVILGFVVVCKIKIMNSTSRDSQTDINREYSEIVDTIYETIKTPSDDLADLGMQVKMTNNDAYTENIQFRSSMGINATNNEAYYMTNVVPVKQNSSYQVGHLPFPNVTIIDSDHSDDNIEKQCKLDGTGLGIPCTNTNECL